MALQHADRPHAKYPMSANKRTLQCPGWVKASLGKPPQESGPAAKEGIFAHECLEKMLRGEEPPKMTREMKNHLVDMKRRIDDIRSQHAGIVMLVEQKNPFPQYIVPASDCGGTVDVFLWSKAARKIWVIDLKYGFRAVLPDYNPQCLGYGATMWWNLPIEHMDIIIHQPRAGGWKVWPVPSPFLTLLQFVGEMWSAIKEAESDNPRVVPGDHCYGCPAATDCIPRLKSIAETCFGNVNVTPFEFVTAAMPDPERETNERLAYLKAAEQRVKDFFAAVDAEIKRRLWNGQTIPGGWKLINTRGEREFIHDTYTTSVKLSQLVQGQITPAEFEDVELKGIGEIEGMLKEWANKQNDPAWRKYVAENFANLTEKKPGKGVKLVPGSDPGDAINDMAARTAGINIQPWSL